MKRIESQDEPHSHDGRRESHCVSRRSFIRGAAVSSLLFRTQLAVPQAAAPLFNDHGRIKPPAPVPDIPLLQHDGRKTTLAHLTLDHATAVQLMFTSCTTTCPIQAAIFQRVQALIPAMAANRIQLLSLSLDPEDDSARALSRWRQRFHAGPNWLAAAPDASDNVSVQRFFGQATGTFAAHSTQVNIIDRRGRLVWRTNELPTSEEIVTILRRL